MSQLTNDERGFIRSLAAKNTGVSKELCKCFQRISAFKLRMINDKC